MIATLVSTAAEALTSPKLRFFKLFGKDGVLRRGEENPTRETDPG